MTLVVLPLYKKPPVAPPDIPNAYYGVAPIFTKSHSMTTSILPNRLTIITDQAIDITLQEGEYGWFYIRSDVGNVRFMDLQLNVFGGWDGATWPDDGSVGETSGPYQITQASDGSIWNLFRTDFPATGQRTYRVYMDVPQFEEPPVEEPPVEEPVDPTPTAPTTPIYGIGVLNDFNEATVLAALTQNHTYTSGETLTVTTAGGDYAYFAVPVSYNPTFVDTASSIPGGWDGAGWPTDGNFGETTGPVAITIAGEAWKIYRTDFPGNGTKTYRVNF